MNQDQFYKQIESNSFFDRWKKSSNIENTTLRSNKREILEILENKINLKNAKVLEIGSFISDLLYYLKKKYNCKIDGVEPSSKACKFAKKKFNLKIINKTFYKSPFFGLKTKYKNKFDLIICDDVLSWIDRDIILETLSSINWILKNNGHIFIRDFSPTKNFAHKNHHWPKQNILNFKVSDGHKSFFTNSGKYKITYNREYYSKKFQKIKISSKQSHRWSDTVIKKTLDYQHKIIKI